MGAVQIFVVAVLVLAVAAIGFVYLAPERFTELMLKLDRRAAGLARKEIDLPGGLRYVYLEGGQGEPLVLLHGFGGMKDNFVKVARFLTPHYHVIVPDEIGFAESSHPPDADYGSQAQAERVHTLAKALGIGRVHLGGNSMGGQIALAYAARYPSEVVSLWLLDPAGVWSAPKGELGTILEARERNPFFIENEEDYVQLARFVTSRMPFIPRPILKVMAQDSIRHLELQKRIFRTMFDDPIEPRAAGLTTPTLIVWGQEDRVFAAGTADVLHRLMPNSQVIFMPGIGHMPMMEAPRPCAEDYLRWRSAI